ncbi:MAG: hypothetical protein NBV68_18125 [Erythrobacter sp.]|uniref:hypothetical protein n=1 Tax=Erythrobacter sp. TaxID=1042 RepID=UPI0025EAF22D|nr:hypothetical protein [Erythrobacter sp.]MCM0001294.1 hypothetical protein [Erythrobacter sp.]
MIGVVLMAQAMIETLDTRPQPEIPATAFACSLARANGDGTAAESFDLRGLIPVAPKGHLPNASFIMSLESATGSPLAGRASMTPSDASDWYRDYQISRRVGTALYVINLKLRREGTSVAHVTVYDDSWNRGGDSAAYEPYRYDAAGLCKADFSPKEQGS